MLLMISCKLVEIREVRTSTCGDVKIIRKTCCCVGIKIILTSFYRVEFLLPGPKMKTLRECQPSSWVINAKCKSICK